MRILPLNQIKQLQKWVQNQDDTICPFQSEPYHTQCLYCSSWFNIKCDFIQSSHQKRIYFWRIECCPCKFLNPNYIKKVVMQILEFNNRKE